MKPLESIRNELKRFKEQDGPRLESVSLDESRIYLSFRTLDHSRYILPIEDAKEVASYLEPKPYPYLIPGHLGVVNLRGNVIPVAALGQGTGEVPIHDDSLRLLMVLGAESEVFALIVRGVRKVRYEMTQSNVVNLDGDPLKQVTANDLLVMIGENRVSKSEG